MPPGRRCHRCAANSPNTESYLESCRVYRQAKHRMCHVYRPYPYTLYSKVPARVWQSVCPASSIGMSCHSGIRYLLAGRSWAQQLNK